MNKILEITDLSHSYHNMDGETPALSHLSFTMQKGEFISIVGPSGCGKSTLLSLISGLLTPEKGSITLHGKQMGYMLQKDHLLEWRSIYRNILLGLEIQQKKSAETRKNVFALLEQYGLADFATAKPSELSGGMRQRAALIRTLVLEPDLLLLDEPFSALDYSTRLSVSDDVYKIIKDFGKTTIIVTHDIAEAVSFSDKVIVLSKGPAVVKNIYNIEFDNKDNWDRLEKICEKISRKDDIWYATNIEIYDYIQAYNALIFRADNSAVYNPTLQTVWFDRDGTLYSVEPGQTLKLKT